MKTIVQTQSNLSKYIFDDEEVISLNSQTIEIGSPLRIVVADLNESNAVVYEGVTPPEDWKGNKYLFDGSSWTANPNYTE